MAYRRHYVIVTPAAAGRRRASRATRAGLGRAGNRRVTGACGVCGIATHRRVGRHRLGTPGTAPRNRARRRQLLRPARHRRAVPPAVSALRFSGVAGLLGAFVASSWFAITGAAAAAQMIHP